MKPKQGVNSETDAKYSGHTDSQACFASKQTDYFKKKYEKFAQYLFPV